MSFFYCDANGSQAGPVPPMDLVSLVRTQVIPSSFSLHIFHHIHSFLGNLSDIFGLERWYA
jgi:hypothetical protein